MISIIWSMFLNNPIARLLAKIAGIALAVLTFGAWQRRQGAQANKAKEAAARAKAKDKTIEDVLRETASDDPADDIRRRMSDRARKP